ncbi:hypothetical protein DID74_01365 [Candidatus Marinamargulisbacteria bacterium SCGC AG-333-B06]|nr:hypothetical protein DID74_01365 [Candidatus Marinamargulisbacteria bacterium SCGC AG-333-B06]
MRSSNIVLIDVQKSDVLVSLCNQSGKLLDQQKRSFDQYVSSDYGRYTDPNEFLYATRSAINSLILALPKRHYIDSIGIVGQMDTFLFCDQESGMVLTPSLYLDDDRATETYQSIKNTSIVRDYESITQQSLSRYSLFTHLKWFIQQGISFFSFSPQRGVCMSLELYLLFNITGLHAFQQDFVSASSTGLFDFKKRDFSSLIIKDLTLNRRCFPELVSPFSVQQKSKGFVPLKDGVPINFMLHSSAKNWLFQSSIQCGACKIHLTDQSIGLEQHIGLELLDSNDFISKSLVMKGDQSFYCLKDVITVPHFSNKLLSVAFDELVARNVSLSDAKSWIILNPNSSELNQEFALINQDGHSLECFFETALLEGLFNVLRLKLEKFESFSQMRPHTFYCTSTLLVHDSVWQLCANIIQHPLVVINMSQSHLGLIHEYNHVVGDCGLGNNFEHTNPYQSKIIPPIQDPISSYARYQTWLMYYEKIFKN